MAKAFVKINFNRTESVKRAANDAHKSCLHCGLEC